MIFRHFQEFKYVLVPIKISLLIPLSSKAILTCKHKW